MALPSYPWSDYEQIPFQIEAQSQKRLDIQGSRRVNALPWRGQFSPELAEYLIGEFLTPGTIIDPFCGSGTTLVEAARLGSNGLGSELNPAAYLLSRVYELAELSPDEIFGLCAELAAQVHELELEAASFERVVDWAESAATHREKVVRDATLLLAAGNGSAIKPGKLSKSAAQVVQLLRSLTDIEADIELHLGDARSLPIESGSATGLLTSPPYINVFNYHQNYRPAVEALGWGVLSSAKAEFGSNRKHRQNRFLTVIQYAQDIAQTLRESARALAPGSTAIWVVGRESRVRGVAMPNPLIVFEAATRSGEFKLLKKQERSFTSRYGQRVYEDVLIFQRTDSGETPRTINVANLGREIGTQVLSSSLEVAADARAEVESALDDADRVLPSVIPEFTTPASWSRMSSLSALSA